MNNTFAPGTSVEAFSGVEALAKISNRSGRLLAGKRAAVVVLSFYPWDPRVRRATEAMARAGMLIDVFCLQESDDQPCHEIIDGVAVHRLRLKRHRKGIFRYAWEYTAFFAWAFWKLTAAGLLRRYDLVHVHNMPNMLVFASLVPKLRGAKVILDMHDPTPELCRTLFNLPPDHLAVRSMIRTEKLSARYADLVLTTNLAFQKLFIARTGFQGKFQIIMNTPSDEIFRARPEAVAAPAGPMSDPRRFRVMYHGLIAERHGLDVLISATKLLAKEIPTLQVDIYGRENPYLKTVLKLIEEAGLAEQVRYCGMKSNEEIARIIEQSDLGIIPNKRTPFTDINLPTRIFELLAMGKPVVVPDSTGIRDYFQRDEILYFTPDDPQDLARVIKWVHDHPAETRQTVQRGHEVYLRHQWKGEERRLRDMVVQLVNAR